MITPEETLIQRALEHEQRTMQRQTLLKKLWKLQQSRADNEQVTMAADEANGRASDAARSHPRTLTSSAPTTDEAAALQA